MSLTTMTSLLDFAIGDVVERLPGHAAGERAVADHRDDVAVLAADGVRLGQPVGVRQGGGGVGVLDDVVLGLGLARVAGQPALLAQPVEVGGAAGEHLVHVGLVPGVEDDPVARRVEDPVDRDGELDDAEVRTEVPAGAGAHGDQTVADLAGQHVELVGGEVAQVTRGRDRLQVAHRWGSSGSSARSAGAPASVVGAMVESRRSAFQIDNGDGRLLQAAEPDLAPRARGRR